MIKQIKVKERDTIIQSLKSGVVPRIGLQHIQVGRKDELSSFIKDIDTISEGGTSFRFVIGEYGSGKTFFMQLVKSIALEKGLVTIHADLSPNKRLHGSDGQARTLFSELIVSASTRTKQDGNALANILERFISTARESAEQNGKSVSDVIHLQLKELKDYVGGYDFAKVVSKYWDGYDAGDDNLKDCALRWLKAEYTTKTDALRDLDVRTFISDASFYDSLKLYAVLVRQAGYKGLLVCLDEMVNLYKIANSVSRKSNYEEILRMLNDSLQGSFSNIGFVMCGTPEFMTDGNRGLYSYEALKSRLSENAFAKQLGVTDYNSVALRLSNLTQEEMLILLKNLRHVYAGGDKDNYLVPDEALISFLMHCSKKIGDSYFRTPRNTIKGFLDLLSTIEQYPSFKWDDIIEQIEVVEDVETTEIGAQSDPVNIGIQPCLPENDEQFASFKL